MMTFAIVTLICGSSSRGVTAIANNPSKRARMARSGVICAPWKKAAIRPDIPNLVSMLRDPINLFKYII